MRITAKQINNEVVKVIPPVRPVDNRPVLGSALFPEVFANIFIYAKKKSGKSTVIYNIIKKCASKDTTIIAFVATLHKDDDWAAIKKYCKINKIEFIGYTSLIDEKTGQNILGDLVKQLENEFPEDEDGFEKEKMTKQEKRTNSLILCEDDVDEENKPRKSKYQSPEYMFILDDLSTELKSISLTSLIKKNRHFNSKVIVSSQYFNDMDKQARKQMDYFLIFKGQEQKKLDEVYKDASISIGEKLFYTLYENATKPKYSFLYIDTANQTFRRNFNVEYNIEE